MSRTQGLDVTQGKRHVLQITPLSMDLPGLHPLLACDTVEKYIVHP